MSGTVRAFGSAGEHAFFAFVDAVNNDAGETANRRANNKEYEEKKSIEEHRGVIKEVKVKELFAVVAADFAELVQVLATGLVALVPA